MSQRNFRRMSSFKTFQRDSVQDARQKLIRGRIQDARQILNKKAQHQNVARFVNPRFQKLGNKQNQFRQMKNNRIGINRNSFIRMGKTNVVTVNRNAFISKAKTNLNNVNRNAFTSKGRQQVLSQNVLVKLKNEILQRKRALIQEKQIKIRGGSIQVTAKQPYQALPVNVMVEDDETNDELEDMTISDLQAYTQLQLPSAQTREMVGTVSSPPATLMASASSVATASSAQTILVSNLHPSVTEDDIKELFGAVGTISSTRFLHPGAALVAYYSKEEAQNACDSYHNRLLDGQPMQCSLLSQTDRHSGRTSIASRLGGRLASQNPSSHNFARVALSSYIPSTVIDHSGFRLRNRDPIFNVRLS